MAPIKTVLITGASSGIGEAFALRYAKAGCRIILIATNRQRLITVADKCRKLNALEVIIVDTDLTDQSNIQNIYQKLKTENIKIDILINNAGIGLLDNFCDQDFKKILELIQINITALTHLTHLFLPDMLRQRKGKIVNIASVYAFTPVPLQAVYAASKNFVLNFSLALADEVKNTGVTVTTICPGSTASNFHQRAGSKKNVNRFTMTAEEVANQSYSAISLGKLIFIPGYINRIFVMIISAIPYRFLCSVVRGLVYRLRNFE